MTPNELLNEITNGPLAVELADALAAADDITIHAALNRKDIVSQGWIDTADFNTWCAVNDAEYKTIKALAANVDSPLYAAANSLLNILSGALGEKALNTGAAHVVYLISVWPFANNEIRNTFLAMGQETISRAEQLGVSISPVDVVMALKNSDGTTRTLV